jgi:hypothetical protein
LVHLFNFSFNLQHTLHFNILYSVGKIRLLTCSVTSQEATF